LSFGGQPNALRPQLAFLTPKLTPMSKWSQGVMQEFSRSVINNMLKNIIIYLAAGVKSNADAQIHFANNNL
jgi:hypothetical protein